MVKLANLLSPSAFPSRMGRLSGISAKEAIKAFERMGFQTIAQQGSHIKMRRRLFNGKIETAIIPNHKQLKEGTLRKGILRPLGIATSEFLKFLKS